MLKKITSLFSKKPAPVAHVLQDTPLAQTFGFGRPKPKPAAKKATTKTAKKTVAKTGKPVAKKVTDKKIRKKK